MAIAYWQPNLSEVKKSKSIMQKHRRKLLLIGSIFALLGMLNFGKSFAQAYPVREIRIIVPGPAGGTSDALARAIAQRLSITLGQQVLVDNRAGASGIIGTVLTAKAAADGYTIMMGHNGTHAINVSLRTNLPYDVLRDFVAISLVAHVPNILVVHPSLPVKSVKQLIALSKSRPGELNYASSGVGFPQHLAAELFNVMAGVKMTHIPYKGSAPALTDVIAGHVQVMFPNLPVALPHVESKRLRALGVTSLKRSSVVPGIPTIAEAGLPGYEITTWFGIFAPAGVPSEIAKRLNAEIVKAVARPEVKELILRQGGDPVGNSSDEFGRFVRAEIVKWAEVIKASGAKAEF